ncbi:hypothetical protein PV682_32570 [Streptomyces niveiscabiei]|uniref:hypothetical protein n=1 Tax=Streptomyces niveiscabiei TaxID=164115 RepID=UPI0029BEADD2|nr:hypothetical protein [Streptomyces niveiscabiei]MDX3386157.1 hypothetical protein [Streptomyces niveiscabiei]
MSYSPSRRRTLLATAVLFGAAGCSSSKSATEETASGAPSASQRVRARAVQDSRGLVKQYDAVLAARPALSGLLAPLRAEVVRHVGAFGGTPSPSASPSASASGAPAEASSGGDASPAPPVDDKSALTQLAATERALADRRAADLLTVPGELARLLASVAAAGAVHAYVLTEGAR